jgi:hypothetical protein
MVCRIRHDERRHAGPAFNIKNSEKLMPVRLIDSTQRRASERSAAPARPANEDIGQSSLAIIPGDDPGDQQPPKSTPWPSRLK